MKKKISITILILIVNLCFVQNAFAQTKDMKQVKNSFDKYKTALMQKDGKAALKLVDQNTLNYYTRMLDLGIYADSSTVATMSLLDKLMVFTIRHRIPQEKVLQMDVNSFFIYAVDNGMVGSSDIENIQLSKVVFNGNEAKTEITVGGKPAPFGFTFHKENKLWKIDLTSILEVSNKATEDLAASYSLQDYEFIFQILEVLSKKKTDNGIWQPLKIR